MSFVNLIPSELLGEIFTACIAIQEKPTILPNTTPLQLTHVCGHWRTVAMGMSILWMNLNITISYRTPIPALPLLRLWVGHSRLQPLTVSVEVEDFLSLPLHSIKRIKQTLNFLSSTSARWKTATFALPGNHRLLQDIILVHGAPILESLMLTVHACENKEIDDINFLLQNAPSLRHFSWKGRASWGSWDTAYEGRLHALQASYQVLTSLVLDTWCTFETAYLILRQCHKLNSLELLHFGGGEAITDFSPYPTIQTELTSITLYQDVPNGGLGSLFHILICPKLKRFSLTIGWPGNWAQSQFNSFILRSMCPLQVLFLEFTCIAEDQLIQCLRHSSSSLKELHVHECTDDVFVTDRLLEMLTYLPTIRELVCPSLEVLNMTRPFDSTDGALAKMLHSRMVQVAAGTTFCPRLKQLDIHIKGCPPKNKLDLQYLKELDDFKAS